MTDRTASVTGLWSATATWGGSAAPTGSQTWHINTSIVVTMDATPGALTGAGDISGTLTITGQGAGTLGAITVNSNGTLNIAGITTGSIGQIDNYSAINITATAGTIGNIIGHSGSGHVLTTSGAITATIGTIGLIAGETWNASHTSGTFGNITGTGVGCAINLTAIGGTLGTIALSTSAVLTTSGAITATVGSIQVLTGSTWTASHTSGTFSGTLTITGSGSSATLTNIGGTLGNITLNTSAALTFAGTAITAVVGTITINTSSTVYQNAIWTTGYTGNVAINSTGLFKGHRTTANFFRCQGTLTASATNGFDYGTINDPISSLAAGFGAAIEMVCASDNLGSRYLASAITNGITVYGAERLQETTLSAVATIGATSVTIANDMALRPGTIAQAMMGQADIICIGHTPVKTGNGAANDETDIYLVQSYTNNGNGTWTIGLADVGVGQAAAYWGRGGTTPNWNDIHQTQREIGTPIYLMANNVLIRGSAYNLRPGYLIYGNYAGSIVNASLWWGYQICYSNPLLLVSKTSFVAGYNHLYGSVAFSCPSTNYHFANQNSTITSMNGTPPLIFSSNVIGGNMGIYGPAYYIIFNGFISSTAGGFRDLFELAIIGGSVLNTGYGIYSCDTTIIGGTISGNLQVGYGSTIIFKGISSVGNYYTAIRSRVYGSLVITGATYPFYACVGELKDSSWISQAEPNLTGFNASSYLASDNNQGSSGAFKAWTAGGIVTKAQNVMPTGATYSYEHACSSATFPCYRQLQYTMRRYEKLHYRTWVRKTVAMTYLPRIQIIDFFADPLVDGVSNPLAQTLMTDSTNTWELIDVYYYNDSDMPKKVILRTLAMNATGTVYFYPSVIKNEDGIVTCDSKGAV